MENKNEEKIKEIAPIEDKIQQIFKLLEVLDITQWNGKNVFEESDADTLHKSLKTAFEQYGDYIRQQTLEAVEEFRDKYETNLSYQDPLFRDAQTAGENALQECLQALKDKN